MLASSSAHDPDCNPHPAPALGNNHCSCFSGSGTSDAGLRHSVGRVCWGLLASSSGPACLHAWEGAHHPKALWEGRGLSLIPRPCSGPGGAPPGVGEQPLLPPVVPEPMTQAGINCYSHTAPYNPRPQALAPPHSEQSPPIPKGTLRGSSPLRGGFRIPTPSDRLG